MSGVSVSLQIAQHTFEQSTLVCHFRFYLPCSTQIEKRVVNTFRKWGGKPALLASQRMPLLAMHRRNHASAASRAGTFTQSLLLLLFTRVFPPVSVFPHTVNVALELQTIVALAVGIVATPGGRSACGVHNTVAFVICCLTKRAISLCLLIHINLLQDYSARARCSLSPKHAPF